MIFRTITTDGGEPVWFDVTWDYVRSVRDDQLQQSDWRAVKDRVLPNQWKIYREALRTLPQRFEDPNEAADHFPEAPSDE